MHSLSTLAASGPDQGATLWDLFTLAGHHPWALTAVFVGLPAVAWAVSLLHARPAAGQSPWKYIYSVLVYLTCVPGIMAGVVTGYCLFFVHENLLHMSLVAFLLPIASMVVTLCLIHRTVDFDLIPGFERLSGLMVMIGVAFALALAIEKTRIWLFFGGSIYFLIALVILAFGLIKWGSTMFFRRSDQPASEPPSPPEP